MVVRGRVELESGAGRLLGVLKRDGKDGRLILGGGVFGRLNPQTKESFFDAHV